MTHRAPRGGVDGVGIAGSVFLIIFAIAARGDNGLVVESYAGVYYWTAVAVLGGLLDTCYPRSAVGFGTVADDFAADVDDVGDDALTLEVLCQEVGGVALGDGVEVELGGGVFLAEEEGAVDGVDGYGGACSVERLM